MCQPCAIWFQEIRGKLSKRTSELQVERVGAASLNHEWWKKESREVTEGESEDLRRVPSPVRGRNWPVPR